MLRDVIKSGRLRAMIALSLAYVVIFVAMAGSLAFARVTAQTGDLEMAMVVCGGSNASTPSDPSGPPADEHHNHAFACCVGGFCAIAPPVVANGTVVAAGRAESGTFTAVDVGRQSRLLSLHPARGPPLAAQFV